jgi:hypothetical protein
VIVPERWFCLTLVPGGVPSAMFGSFGGDWEQALLISPPEARAMTEGLPARIEVPVIRGGAAGGGAFMFEDSSAQGARTEVLRRLSHGGQAVSVSLKPGGLPRLRWAEDGQLAAELTLNRPGHVQGPASGRLRELLAERPSLAEPLRGYKHRAVIPPGIALAQALCGAGIEPGILDSALRGGLVLPVLPDPEVPGARPAAAKAAALIAAAEESTAARAARKQAIRMIGDLGLDDEFPEIAEIRRVLSAGRNPEITDESAAGLLIRRFTSPLHWHTVTAPDVTPAIKPALTARALTTLRLLATAAPRQALAAVYNVRQLTSRRGSARPAEDLEDDLGQPALDIADITRVQQREQSEQAQRGEALGAVRRPAAPFPSFGGADASWDWVLPLLPQGLCLTFADGLEPGELLTRLADAPGAPGPEPAEAGAGRIPGWAFAVEHGTAVAAQAEAIAKISLGTRAVCLRHDSNGTSRFCYAEDGVLITELSPLTPGRRAGADPDRYRAEITDAGLTHEATPATAITAIMTPFRLATRLFGIVLDGPAASVPELTAPLSGPPAPLPGHGIPRLETPVTTPGGLLWWPRPGDPERPWRQRVRPTVSPSHPPNAPIRYRP